ncbi:MAG: efflux RND transporter permease subunit [Planctomycetes bacterium]|nr:efflux RND transporter permease subunit [Planctomycetota bacterium]
MRVAEVSIRRPVFTLVLALSTLVFGGIGFSGMGVDLNPEVELPYVTVSAALEGASPEVMELSVTQVIEDELGTLSQIESVTSQSAYGNASVTVEFSLGKDIDVAVQEVRDRVAAAQRRLPEEMDPPLIQKLNLADQPIMWIAATSDGDYWELARWCDQVAQDRLQQIEGVGAVTLGAFRRRAYRVWLDTQALAARGMGPLDVQRAIARGHVELPAGRAEGRERDVALRVFGEFETADELGSLILAGGERPVRLRDVARVEPGLEEARSMARFNGVPSVGLGVRKQSGSNTVAVAERVREFLPELEKSAPPGVRLQVAFDSSRFIANSIRGVQFDIVFGALLTVLVMYLFLQSGRATLIAALAIPTSLVSTFALMKAAGFTMNNFTMLGLSLAVGMVIDDAIVIIENVYRQMEKGLSRMEAAREAVREVGFAVVVATASIVSVFVPIAYMKGILGRFFFQFGITVAFALAVSLAIALTLTPMLASRMLSRGDESRRMRPLPFWALVLAIAVLLGACLFRLLGEWHSPALVAASLVVFAVLRGRFESIYRRIERAYARALGWALAHRAPVLAGAAVLFAAAVGLAASRFVTKEMQRPSDESRFLIRFEAPLGTSLAGTDRLARQLEARILDKPEIAGAFVAAGFGGGGAPQPNTGISFINMVPRDRRERSQDEVMAELRRDLNQIPGLVVFVDRIPSMGGGGQRNTDLQFVVQGPEVEELAGTTDRIVARLRSAGGYIDVDSNLDLQRPEARIEIDRDRAELLGVSVDDVTNAINMMMGGTNVAYFREGGDRYWIRVRAPAGTNSSPRDIERILVRSKDGRMVQLGNVVTVREAIGPNVIPRYNRQRAATLYANLSGKPLGEAMEELEGVFAETLPPGGLYTAQPAGSSKTFRDSARYALFALGLSVVVVYLVLAAQFESFLHPFTIMMTLPLAFVGVVAGLLATGLSLDLFSTIGILMLAGIATKNGILLVDYSQHLRAAGKPRDEAVREAGPVRLRPVLMTAVTTMVGTLPVALAFSEGGESRASMGVAVFSGMFASTALTLLVIPVVYTLLDDVVAWARSRSRTLARLALATAAAGLLAGSGIFLATGSLYFAAALGAGTFALPFLLATVALAAAGWVRRLATRRPGRAADPVREKVAD